MYMLRHKKKTAFFSPNKKSVYCSPGIYTKIKGCGQTTFSLSLQNLSTINNTIKCTQKIDRPSLVKMLNKCFGSGKRGAILSKTWQPIQVTEKLIIYTLTLAR